MGIVMKNIVLLLSLIITIIPIIFIGYIFYKGDTEKEPRTILTKLFISGIFSALIVIFLSLIGLTIWPILSDVTKINDIIILLLYTYIFIALIEEVSKFIMIYKISYNSKEFDQAYDIILYSVYVGLGFAFFENIIYAFNNPNIELAIARGLTSVPAHICFQTIMGYYLYQNKHNKNQINLVLAILIPVLLHGTYDLFIFSNSLFLVFIDFIIIICMLFFINPKIKYFIDIDKKKLKKITK